jgi:hypothetical protein
MNEEVIIGQLGLLLSTLRYMRRAVEDIERNTARYSGISFAPVFSEGARFGEPPLLNGALKVYIVNINDLTAPPEGGILEGILGGVGRFIGGAVGGLIGGTMSGIVFPLNLHYLDRITSNIGHILDRVDGIVAHLRLRPEGEADTSEGGGMFTGLPRLTALLNDVRRLLEAAGQGPGTAPGTPQPEQSAGVAQILTLVRAISGVVDGLILLLPILNGFLASLLVRLDAIKLAVVDLLEWLVRNLLLLRGVALVVVLDTLAAVARLAAQLFRIISTLVGELLTSAFDIVTAVLSTVVTAIGWVGTAVQGTVNDLMEFLRIGVGNLLIWIGNTRVFQLLFHLIDILPGILPALIRLRDPEGKGPGLTDEDRALLDRMTSRPILRHIPYARPGGGTTGGVAGSGVIGSFPDLSRHLPDPATVRSTLETTRDTIVAETTTAFGAVETALRDTGAALQSADFQSGLNAHLRTVEERSGVFAATLQDARREAAAGSGIAGDEILTQIATAYEGWLQHGGLETLMTQLSAHFHRNRALPEAAVGATPHPETPRATVEIERVEIIIDPPAAPGTQATPAPRTSRTRTSMWSPWATTPTPDDVRRGWVPDPDPYPA